ncbi:hypothetical protein JTB14_026618, partial [Gonioctena quinquepunctata]
GDDDQPQPEPEEQLGRGHRDRRLPIKLDDYVLSNYSKDYELLSCQQAISGEEKSKWKEAIEEEKEAHVKNSTWILVDRSEAKDKNIISSRWIFKMEDDGRYRACLVVRSCQQRGDNGKMKKFLNHLQKESEIKIDENPDTYLGITFSKSCGEVKLSQEGYAQQVVDEYRMIDAKPTSTPLVVGSIHNPDTSENEVNFPFREAVGSLLYLSTETRPDISLAVSISSRHVEKPTQSDVVNLKRTIKYINST